MHILSGIFAACLAAATVASARADTRHNVILLTLDGIRWQEFFASTGESPLPTPFFSSLWSELAGRGVVYGSGANRIDVANSANYSLPSYQSILAGAKQDYCNDNYCGRIRVETLPERLVRQAGFRPRDVATIASWDKIALAAEHREGSTFVNCGAVPLRDPDGSRGADAINDLQRNNPAPWDEVRWDRHTFAHAVRYLRENRPRFLYISLNDSDSWAHSGDYAQYTGSIRMYDRWISLLVRALGKMGDYGKNTTLLVTTDHGRGDGDQWPHHGPPIKEASRIWLFATGPRTKSAGRVGREDFRTHADIRPTIETLYGLEPVRCTGCGSPLPEVVGN